MLNKCWLRAASLAVYLGSPGTTLAPGGPASGSPASSAPHQADKQSGCLHWPARAPCLRGTGWINTHGHTAPASSFPQTTCLPAGLHSSGLRPPPDPLFTDPPHDLCWGLAASSCHLARYPRAVYHYLRSRGKGKAVLAWTGHPASQRLSFLIYKMGTKGTVKNNRVG